MKRREEMRCEEMTRTDWIGREEKRNKETRGDWTKTEGKGWEEKVIEVKGREMQTGWPKIR